MTASAVATPLRRAPLLTRVASAVRARSAEALVFSVAAVVALLHALDDAFLLPGGGVPLTQHALAASIALVASVLAVLRFPSLRPGIRAAVAFTPSTSSRRLAAMRWSPQARSQVSSGKRGGWSITRSGRRSPRLI